jgi:hypothetical protein
MNWTIAKFAAAGVLTVMPIAAVAIPAYAVASSDSMPSVLPGPLPADPANDPPTPPSHHGEYYNPNDANDWWYYGGDSGGGGGGG